MKKILFIATHNPFQPHSGARQRTSLILDALTENNNVDLVCFTDNKNKNYSKNNCSIKYFGPVYTENRSVLSKLWAILKFFSIYSLYPKNPHSIKIITQLMSETKYDFVIIRYVSSALMCGLTEGSRIIIDIDDLPEQWFMSLSRNDNFSLHLRIYYRIKSLLGKYYTNKLMKNIYHSFLPNRNQISLPNSSHLPNIPFPSIKSETASYRKADINSYNILIVGNMSYSPNYYGVDYFIRNIWEKIKEKVPEGVLNIAGKNLPLKWQKRWEKFKDVNYLGFVPDIFEEYSKSQVVVAPIYQGAGTNIKVLEAMKMKKATVITNFAGRGYEGILKDSENILIAQSDIDFSNKVILALIDKKLNTYIGTNASKVINEHFSYIKFKNIIQKVVD